MKTEDNVNKTEDITEDKSVDVQSQIKSAIAEAFKSFDDERKTSKIKVSNPYDTLMENKKNVKTSKYFNNDADAIYFAHSIFKDVRPESDKFMKTVSTYQRGANDGDGGYLVPTEIANSIITLRDQYGVARRNCKIEQMGSDTKDCPISLSGLTAAFVSEGSVANEQKKTYGMATLVAKKMKVLTYYSEELDEDAIVDIADDLAFDMAIAFAKKEDQVIFNGNGEASDGGIDGIIPTMIENDSIGIIDLETSLADLKVNHLTQAIGLLPDYAFNPKWFMNKEVWGVVEGIQRATGGTSYVMSATQKPIPQLFGYPVEFVENMNTEIGGIDILFGDLKTAVLFGNRRGITVKSSDKTDVGFEQDLISIKATQRIAGKVFNVGNGTSVGGVVALAINGTDIS